MKNIQTITVLLISGILSILSLVSCSSQPQTVQYYLLPHVSVAEPLNPLNYQIKVKVADYLSSNRIALMTASQGLQYSQQHKWAQSLNVSIQSLIEKKLMSAQSQFVECESIKNCRLDIYIERLHGHVNGQVVLSGHWKIRSNRSSQSVYFDFNSNQTQAGYPEMIKEMTVLLTQLSTSINLYASGNKL